MLCNATIVVYVCVFSSLWSWISRKKQEGPPTEMEVEELGIMCCSSLYKEKLGELAWLIAWNVVSPTQKGSMDSTTSARRRRWVSECRGSALGVVLNSGQS